MFSRQKTPNSSDEPRHLLPALVVARIEAESVVRIDFAATAHIEGGWVVHIEFPWAPTGTVLTSRSTGKPSKGEDLL